MDNNSTLQQKRVSIRNQRRKDEIQSIFASKRKLLLEGYLSQSIVTLVQYFELIAQNKQTSRNLRYLSNLLADDRPFDFFDMRGAAQNKQEIQQYCENLCNLILRGVIKQYRTESREDVEERIACLTVISNLLADREVDNHLLFKPICAFLREVYFSVQVWGRDKQIHEVGWLISNLIGKEIAHNSEQDVKYIFQWIEELLDLEQPGLLAVLYKNLGVFITSVQQKYRNTGCELPEVHTSSIINILALTVQKNLSSSKPVGVLLRVVEFLSSKLYLLLGYCPKSIPETMVSRLIVLMGYISQELSTSAITFVRKMIGVCNMQDMVPRQRRVLQSMEKIRYIIAQNYSAKLMQLLLLKQSRAKRELISLIQTLINSPSQHTNFIIALLAGAGLEEVLASLAKAGDRELLLDIMHLAYDIQRISKGNYGFEFVSKVESELSQFLLVKQKGPSPI